MTLAADGGLDRHLEHLARDELLELLDERLPGMRGLVAVDDEREGVDRLAVDEDVELDQLRGAVADLLVVHRGVALGAALELVVEVDDELGERHLEGHEDARRVEVFHVEERCRAGRSRAP